jgi:predicted nucleic acid-binding protein
VAAGLIYLLDTNAISDLMRAAPRIENWMAGLDQGDRVVTCTIVRGEVLFGIARLPAGRRRAELEEAGDQFLAALRCEPIPERAGDHYATVKLARQQRGLTLDENDIWVAATALALGATLVSRDSDFANIDGLPVVVLE